MSVPLSVLKLVSYIVTIDANPSSTPCAGAADLRGSFTVAVYDGTPPYFLSVDGGEFAEVPDTGLQFTGMAVGSYQLVATDSSDPAEVETATFELRTLPGSSATLQAFPSLQGKDHGSGSIRITNIVAEAPYTLTLTGPQSIPITGDTWGPLLSGPYVVTIRNRYGCSTALPVTVPVYCPCDSILLLLPSCSDTAALLLFLVSVVLLMPLEAVRPSCPNKPTGGFTTRINQYNYGTAPYTYYMMSGPNRYIVTPDAIVKGPTTNLTVVWDKVPAGVWTVMAFDSSSFINSFSSLPNQPNGFSDRQWSTVNYFAPIETAVSYDAEDSGASDGAVSVTIAGGTGPVYTYFLNGVLKPSLNFTGLAAGRYNLRIYDNGTAENECFQDISFEVARKMAASITNVSPTCAASGRITISASGGIAPISYRLLPLPDEEPRDPQLGSTITGLTVGERSVIAIDSRGVQIQLNTSIPFATNGVNITSVVLTNASLAGAMDGSARVSVINGGAGTLFRLVSRDGVVARQQSNGTFLGLPAGLYLVEVSDAFSCKDSREFEVSTSLTIDARATLAACSSLTIGNGRISAYFAFGARPYNVTLGTESVLLFQDSYNFDNLVAGVYNLSVVDALNVTRTFEVTVPGYTFDVAKSLYQSAPYYQTSPGYVFWSYFSENFEWRYSYEGSWLRVWDTSFRTAPVGELTVIARDSRGCTQEIPIYVPSHFTLSLGASLDANTYCKVSTYTLTATPVGGLAPFSYTLEGAPAQDHNGWLRVPAGAAVVTGTYSLRPGFTYSALASIPLPEAPRPGAFIVSRALVDPATATELGKITIVMYDALNDPELRFVLDGTTTSMSPTFANVPIGPHTVEIIDSHGCSTSVSVYVPAKLVAAIITRTDRCFASVSGGVTISASGGVEPYLFLANGIPRSSVGSIGQLDAGDYLFVARDSSPTPQTVELRATIGTFPKVVASAGQQFAPNVTATGMIWVNATGLAPPYQYRLSPGLQAFQGSNIFEVAVGNWVIETRDGNGCIESKAFSVAAVLSVEIDNSAMACPAQSAPIAFTYIGGTAPFSLQLDGSAVDEADLVDATPAGRHVIVVTDSSSPPQTYTVDFVVPEYPRIQISYEVTPQTSDVPDGTLVVDASTPGYPSLTFSYEFGGPRQPSNTFTGLSAVVNQYLYVEDSQGCYADAYITIPLRSLYLVSSQQPSCMGLSNGWIRVNYTADTFTGPVNLTVVETGQILNSSLTAGNLPAGSYRFYLRDSVGAEATLYVALGEPDALSASVSAQRNDAIDPSVPNTYLYLSGHGGTSPYTHRFDIAGAYSSGSISQAAPFSGYRTRSADFGWSVVDSKGCSVQGRIYGLPSMSISLSGAVRPSCLSSQTGSATVVASGGLPPYSFSILPQANQTGFTGSPFGDSFSMFQAAPGDYIIKVTDSSSANRSATVRVSVGEVNIGFALATESGSGFSTIHMYPTDWSLSPYYFAVRGGVSYTNDHGHFYNVLAGDYELTLYSRTTTCSVSKTVSVADRLEASLSSSTAPSCNLPTGSATISAIGGTAPLKYIWNGEITDSPSRTGLLGVYSLVVQDSANPPNQVVLPSLALLSRPPLELVVRTRDTDRSIDFGVVVISVANAAGSLAITIDGRAANLGYNPDVRAGAHVVQVTDAAGCSATQTVTTRSRVVVAAVAGVVDAACCEDTASVTLRANEGWEYARLDQEVWQDSPAFIGLTTGRAYEFLVRDKTDPGDYQSVVYLPPRPSCFRLASVTPTQRKDVAGGQISVSVSGTSTFYLTVGSNPRQYVSGLTTALYLLPASSATANVRTTYNVSVSTVSGCTDWKAVSIDPPLIVTPISTPGACYGDATGSVRLQMTSGVAPYSIWNTTEGSPTADVSFGNLSPGQYSFRVSDSGLPARTVVVFTSFNYNPQLYLWDQELPFTANMIVRASPSGGVPPYQYIFGPKNNASAAVSSLGREFTISQAGEYNLTVHDSAGCRVSSTVNAYSGLSGTVSYTNKRCVSGVRRYQINITPSGGSGQYETAYRQNEFAAQTSWDTNELVPHALVRDLRTRIVAYLDTPSPFSGWDYLAATITAVTGSSGSNGAFTVVATGGIGPFTYSINGGAFQPSATFTLLAAGRYEVAVKDTAGCTYETLAWVPVTSALVASIDTSLTATYMSSCSPANGRITVLATGGSASYSYSLDGAAPQVSNVFNGVAGGNHTIVVTSGSETYQLTYITYSPPPVSVSYRLAYEYGAYRAYAKVSGGFGIPVALYTFYLNGTSVGITTSSELPINIRAYGNWNLRVASGFGCESTVPLYYYLPHTISVNSTAVSCRGDSDGTISVAVTLGGSGSFSYRKNPSEAFQSSSVFTGLAPGAYQIDVLDSLTSSIATQYIVVQEPDTLDLSYVAKRPARGTSTGSLYFTISGGTRPYTLYLEDTLASSVIGYSEQLVYHNLPQILFFARAEDAKGCQKPMSAPVVLFAEFSFTTTTSYPTCANVTDGQIVVNAPTGGVPPFQYGLIRAAGNVSNLAAIPWQSAQTFSSVGGGVYTVYVKDSGSPAAIISAQVALPAPEPLRLSYSSTGSTAGSSSATVSFYAFGGTPPYYLNYGAFATSFATNASVGGIAVGVVSASLEDDNGCSVGVNVVVYETISVVVDIQTDVECRGARTGSITLLATGGSGGYRFRVIQRGSSSDWQNSPTFSGLAAGTYSFLVEDTGDMAYSAIITDVVITEPLLPLVVLPGRTSRSDLAASTGQIVVATVGVVGSAQFRLDNGPWGPSSTFVNVSAGVHNVTLTDSRNCVATTSVTVFSIPQFTIVPSAPSCGDREDGKLTITVAGGVPPFTYTLQPRGTVQSDGLFSGLTPGVFTITGVDSGSDGGATVTQLDAIVPQADEAVVSVATLYRASSVRASVTGGAGAPYTWSPDNLVGDSVVFYSPFPTTKTVYDSVGCGKRVVIDAVGYFSTRIVDTQSTCTGAGPSQVTIKIKTDGGLAPYFHNVAGNYYDDGAAIPIPPSWLGGRYEIRTFDSLNRMASYVLYVRFPGVASVLAPTSVYTYPTTATGRSDGLLTFELGPGQVTDFSLTPVSVSFVRNGAPYPSADFTINTRNTPYVNLPSGNYTATLSAGGCTSPFNFTIVNPAAPRPVGYNCLIKPADQLISCTFVPQAGETYELQFASGPLNQTQLPDVAEFVPFRIEYRTGAFGFVPGRTYFIKLVATGPGGTTESVITLETRLSRPIRPSRAAAVYVDGGVQVSWTRPEDPVNNDVVYDVYAWRSSVLLRKLATGVSDLTVFINSSDLAVAASGGFLAPGTQFYYLIVAVSPLTGLESFMPAVAAELPSPAYFYVAPPTAPSSVSVHIESARLISTLNSLAIGRCDGRCAYLRFQLFEANFGGPDNLGAALKVDVKPTGSSNDEVQTLYDAAAPVSAKQIYVLLSSYPFGYYATVRITVSNAVGAASYERQLILSEPPLRPILEARASSADNQNYTRITLSCYDLELALGVQRSTFRYEYVTSLSSSSADWTDKVVSPELSGPLVDNFWSNGTYLHSRCFAVNSAGEVLNQNGVQVVYLPPALPVPSNLRVEILGRASTSQDSISVRLAWDYALNAQFDVRVVGQRCSDSVVTLQTGGTDMIVYTSCRCALSFAVRAKDGRGATDWSPDFRTTVNVAPRSPYDLVVLGAPEYSELLSVPIRIQARQHSQYLNADSVLFGSIEFTSNLTDVANETFWNTVGTASRGEFSRNILTRPGQSNSYIGPAFSLNISVQARPIRYYFRARMNNGLDSSYATLDFVITGRPVPPVITSALTFTPTNCTLVYNWNVPVLDSVLFHWTAQLTSIANVTSSRNGVINGTSLALTNFAAGTNVALSITASTGWADASGAGTRFDLAASGTYWPFNTTVLRPNITRVDGMTVILTWKADNTPHGFSRTLYRIALARSFNDVPVPVVDVDEYAAVAGSISYQYRSALELEDATFAIIPRNPFGDGPVSAPSDLADFRYPRTGILNAAIGHIIAATENSSMLEITWQQARRVNGYRLTLSEFINEAVAPGPEIYIYDNITCCSFFANVTKLKRYYVRMYFSDPLYGYLLDNRGFPTNIILGLPDTAIFDSVIVSGANATGAFFDFTWGVPRSNTITGAGTISTAVRYSVSGSGSWEQASVAASCSSYNRVTLTPYYVSFSTFRCTSRYWYRGPVGQRFDFQVAAVTDYGRGGWSSVRTAGVAGAPAAVSAWLDETDAAVAHPNATARSDLLLPLRWNNQHPYAADIVEYQIRVYLVCSAPSCQAGFYQVPTWSRSYWIPDPSAILCDLDPEVAPCAWPTLRKETFIPTPSQASSASNFAYWLSLALGAEQRIILYGRNTWGWAVLYDGIHLPNPANIVSNLRATSVERSAISGPEAYRDYYYHIQVRFEWETTYAALRFQEYAIYAPGISAPVAEVVDEASVSPQLVQSYLRPRCSRIAERPAFASCSLSIQLRNNLVVTPGASLTMISRVQRGGSPYLNSTILATRSLNFPNLWDAVINPTAPRVGVKGDLLRVECDFLANVDFQYYTGPSGERLRWRRMRVYITNNAFSKGAVALSYEATWRNGELPVKRGTLSYTPVVVNPNPGNSNGQNYVIMNQQQGQYVEIPWLVDGGVFDVSLNVTEGTEVPGYSFQHAATATCNLPSQPRAPVSVTSGAPVTSEDGVCKIPMQIVVDGVTGYNVYTHIIVRTWRYRYRNTPGGNVDQQESAFGQTWFPVGEIDWDPIRKTYSLTLKVPLDNYIWIEASLVNAAGMQSYFTRDPYPRIWTSSGRSLLLSPSTNVTSVQGNQDPGQLQIVWNPPLPSSLVASPHARIRIDDSTIYTLPYNNISFLNVPALSAGVHQYSVSLDAIHWGPNVPFTALTVPLSPAVVRPEFVDIRRPFFPVEFSHPNLRSLVNVFCDWETIRVVGRFSESRETVYCDNPVYSSITPRYVTLSLNLDGTQTAVLTQVWFWDSAIVTVPSISTSTDNPSIPQAQRCSSGGSTTLYLTLSRWPFPPASHPVYTYWLSNTGLSDPFNITFSWNATATAYTASWPFVPPDFYDFVIGDGDDLRFARTPFRHSRDCNSARQDALQIRFCDSCTGSRTWIYRPGAYGQCVPTSDAGAFTGIGWNAGCPPGYLAPIVEVTPIFHRGNATYLRPGGSLVTVRASMQVVNPTGFLSGTGTWGWSSRFYPFVSVTNGTWAPAVGSSTYQQFTATLVVDPWTAALDRQIELFVSLPGQFGRTLSINLPFRPGAVLHQPESQAGSNNLLIFNAYGSFTVKPFFIIEFANPELVTSARIYLTVYETFPVSRVRDVAIERYDACRSCPSPSFGRYLPAIVVPRDYNWNPRDFQFPYSPGVHRINVIINEGLPSQEIVSNWFALLDMKDAREALGVLKNGGSFSDRCSNTIDRGQICFEAGYLTRPSAYFPFDYPEGRFVCSRLFSRETLSC